MKPLDPDGWFLAVQRIVEERIRQAQKEGLFDDLPGKGKPLELEDDSRVDPTLRSAYRLLKNAGILPREMQVRREITRLRQLLDEVDDEDQARSLAAELNEKIMEFNIMGRFSAASEMDQVYTEKILRRIRGGKGRLVLERRYRDRGR